MGFDVSFHPISPAEMDMWYFTPLEWVRQGQKDKVLDLAEQYGMEAFYAQKYLSVLQAGAAVEEQELFDKSHGFYLAVVQGFFLTYYYTRGSAFSFLIEEKPVYRRYTTPWCGVTPRAFPNPAENGIVENYCAGVYLAPAQVVQLLEDLERDPKVRSDLERQWCGDQLPVLVKALQAAREQERGLLEATEVVEPNPISPNESCSYSNLFHCDKDGVYLFLDTALKQLVQAREESK